MSKLRTIFIVSTGATVLFSGYELHQGNPKFYANVAMPVIQRLTSAESAHRLGILSAKYGLYPRCSNEYERLQITVMGKKFRNPIGLAAGFDKHIEAPAGLLNFGFGFIEVGGVTPVPQPGNDKPRVFRLCEDGAIINRYGFNSEGIPAAVSRLERWSKQRQPDDVIAVNLGKNKTTTDAASDYVKGVEAFGPLADFLVINISSPNTPGLRQLQGQEQLRGIVTAVCEARDKLVRADKPPIFIKIAPDLTDKDKIDIATVVTQKNCGVEGLIISNTTVSRPKTLMSPNKVETGGLSGKPLKDMSTDLIREMYRLTSGRLTLIGVGGVFTGKNYTPRHIIMLN